MNIYMSKITLRNSSYWSAEDLVNFPLKASIVVAGVWWVVCNRIFWSGQLVSCQTRERQGSTEENDRSPESCPVFAEWLCWREEEEGGTLNTTWCGDTTQTRPQLNWTHEHNTDSTIHSTPTRHAAGVRTRLGSARLTDLITRCPHCCQARLGLNAVTAKIFSISPSIRSALDDGSRQNGTRRLPEWVCFDQSGPSSLHRTINLSNEREASGSCAGCNYRPRGEYYAAATSSECRAEYCTVLVYKLLSCSHTTSVLQKINTIIVVELYIGTITNNTISFSW